jgi:hypothetical protein
MTTIHLSDQDKTFINQTINEAIEFIANATDEKYNFLLVQNLEDVFETLNK